MILEPAFSRKDARTGMVLRSTGGRRKAPRLLEDCNVRVAECSIVNLPEAKRVAAHLRLSNLSGRAVHGHVRLAVMEPGTGKILASVRVPLTLLGNESRNLSSVLDVQEAILWDLERQSLYKLNVSWHTRQALHPVEERETEFAFYEFPVEGIGADSMFRLSNRRKRLGAAMSWGYWSANGLAPISELAARRVRRVEPERAVEEIVAAA